MNILIKLTSIVALIIAPHIAIEGGAHSGHGADAGVSAQAIEHIAELQQPIVFGKANGSFDVVFQGNHYEGAQIQIVRFHMTEDGTINDFEMQLMDDMMGEVAFVNPASNLLEFASGGKVYREGNRYLTEGECAVEELGGMHAVVSFHFENEKTIRGTVRLN